MRQATNCFLIGANGKILLSMKKRGFGIGKWNGAGGKIQGQESAEQTAVREVQEEVGVIVEEGDLEKVAEIKYSNPDPNWGMFVHVYITRKWKGEPSESEEMKPEWFAEKDIPFKDTWADFPHWFPKVLEGKKFKGEFVYKADGETVDHFDITPVDNLTQL